MKESEPQVAPVANAAGSPTLRITSSDVQRKHRIPPRQVLTRKWPVLHAGSVPDYAYFDSLGQTHQDWRAQWTFRIWGLVNARGSAIITSSLLCRARGTGRHALCHPLEQAG